MSTEASTTIISKQAGNSSQSNRPKWRRATLIGGVVIVILAIVADTKVIRIGSSEDLRQAAFSPAAYGAKAFPGIKQAIEERAVEAAVLQTAILANKDEATAKYGIAGCDHCGQQIRKKSSGRRR